LSYLDSYQKRGIFFQRHKLFYTTIIFAALPDTFRIVACMNVLFTLTTALAITTPAGIAVVYSKPTIFSSLAARSIFWVAVIIPNRLKLLVILPTI